MLLHDFPCSHAAHRFTAGIQDDIVGCRVGEGATYVDPGFQVFLRLAPEGHQTLLVALTDGGEPLVIEIQLR